ncbi:MAG TPA: hypothetical protein VGN81_19120 [Pseudonocardiaceae bacterium]|jgi:type VI protein secretion system component VasF
MTQQLFTEPPQLRDDPDPARRRSMHRTRRRYLRPASLLAVLFLLAVLVALALGQFVGWPV